MRKYSNLIIWFVVLIAIVVLFNTLGPQAPQPKAYTMNEFVKQVKAKQVKEATVYDTARQITGTLKNKTKFEVNYPEGYQAVDLLVKYGVKTTVERPNEWVTWAVQTLSLIHI